MRIYSVAIIFFVGIFLLISCSIEKRIYRPGYNVEWNNSNPANKKHEIAKSKINNVSASEIKTEKIATNEGKEVLPSAFTESKSLVKAKSNSISSYGKPDVRKKAIVPQMGNYVLTGSKTILRTVVNKIIREGKSTRGSDKAKRGLRMVILGLLILILGYFVFRSLPIFFWVCETLAALLIIIGLIRIIVS